MWWTAAADIQAGDGSQPVVVALISALGGVMVAALGALVSMARRDSNRTQDSPPAPNDRERIAVLERRAEDNDEQRDIQDHTLDVHGQRLDRVEWWMDREHPDWRP